MWKNGWIWQHWYHWSNVLTIRFWPLFLWDVFNSLQGSHLAVDLLCSPRPCGLTCWRLGLEEALHIRRQEEWPWQGDGRAHSEEIFGCAQQTNGGFKKVYVAIFIIIIRYDVDIFISRYYIILFDHFIVNYNYRISIMIVGNLSIITLQTQYPAVTFALQVPNPSSVWPAQDTAVNPFFDELWKHWHVQSGCTDIPIEVDDSDDESSDFTMYLCVKSDPYGPAPDGNGGAVKAGKSELAPPVVAPVEEPTIPVEKLVIVEDSPLKLTPKKEEVDAMPMSTAQIEGRIAKLKFLALTLTQQLSFFFSPQDLQNEYMASGSRRLATISTTWVFWVFTPWLGWYWLSELLRPMHVTMPRPSHCLLRWLRLWLQLWWGTHLHHRKVWKALRLANPWSDHWR